MAIFSLDPSFAYNYTQHGETAISPQSEEGSETRIPGEVTERHKEMDKWEVFRTVKQLFIRGDNIILITPI